MQPIDDENDNNDGVVEVDDAESSGNYKPVNGDGDETETDEDVMDGVTLHTEDLEAVERRDTKWQEHRRRCDSAYERDHDSFCRALTTVIIGNFWLLPDIWKLVSEFAQPRREVYVAMRRVLELVPKLPAIHSNELQDSDWLSFAADIVNYDATDGTYGDPQFRDSTWYHSFDRTKQKFRPFSSACDGCKKLVWIEFGHPRAVGSFYARVRLKRTDIRWLPCQNRFVCKDCFDRCFCTAVRVESYRRSCRVCQLDHCSLHNFEIKDRTANPFSRFGFERKDDDPCNDCKRTLALGRVMSKILSSTDPRLALEQYIQSI